jgi:putative membrane protein
LEVLVSAPAAARNPIPWILLVSAGIVAFLIWLLYIKTASPTDAAWVSTLPAVNALLNTLCACCLISGWSAIRCGRRAVHIRFMLSAAVLSALFFASYVTYHHFHGDTPFTGQGTVRVVYFAVLISHIVLSVVVLPLIISTLFYASKRQFVTHRKIARYTLPIWLYVSITGVLVFFLLRTYA